MMGGLMEVGAHLGIRVKLTINSPLDPIGMAGMLNTFQGQITHRVCHAYPWHNICGLKPKP
jgi:hypothetical protein